MSVNSIKTKLALNLKNVIGFKTKRKIVVFSVDDYGNVRLHSKEAREKLNRQRLKILNRFDALDSLENTEDLNMLYDALTSAKDKNGNHAVFTPFALPVNINFEKMQEENFQQYHYELLPETFTKLGKEYEGAWELWKEGMRSGLMVPQCHGREHINLKIFNKKLQQKDQELLTALKNRSYTSINDSDYKTISYTAAFQFEHFEENQILKSIASDALEKFKAVFGYNSIHFNAPGGSENTAIHEALKEGGVKYIDAPLIKNEHYGNGKYKKKFNYTGKKNHLGQIYLVRNVVFEPTENRGLDWLNFTIEQIEAAFRWNKPANISSHRINFCGNIDPSNRQKGISSLKKLIKAIVKRWPDVEFMSSVQLGELINKDKYVKA